MNEMKRMLREIESEVQLTRSLIGKDTLDPRVMQAISQVQRHKFVPKSARVHGLRERAGSNWLCTDHFPALYCCLDDRFVKPRTGAQSA